MSAVRICDVAPRDGLQNEPQVLAPETRAELCRRLLRAGMPVVEAASLVRDDRVPQMAGGEQVLAGLDPAERGRCAVLVLNERGLDRALATGVTEVHLAVMATETFSRRNLNADVETSLAGVVGMAARARAAGVRVSAAISVAFGCPFEGRVDPARVVALAERLAGGRGGRADAGRHHRRGRAGGRGRAVLGGRAGWACPSASISTTRTTTATTTRGPPCWRARRSSSRPPAASAAARSRRARPATSPPRTWSTGSRARASNRRGPRRPARCGGLAGGPAGARAARPATAA